MKKILFFRKALTQEGGAERLLLEVAGLAKNFGFEGHILVLSGGDTTKLFNGHFSYIKVETLYGSEHPSNFFNKILISLIAIFQTRKFIKETNPDFIFAQGPDDAEVIYFATLGMNRSYSTFIHQSLFWCPDDVLKYFPPFRKHFKEIINSVWGHKYFIPEKLSNLNPILLVVAQFRAILNYLVVRKAKNIFVPSSIMGKEVSVLYGKESISLKMGADEKMFDYLPKQDIKQKLGIGGETMVLEVSRLDQQKRLDLAIRAFGKIANEFPETRFVIGGKGPERERLENLIKELGLEGKVILLGYVAESNLKDLHASCDVAFHPAWVDFDVSFIEPLVLGKKVVCSTEYELVDNLLKLKGELIFPANPTVQEMSQALKTAILHQPKKKESMRNLLSDYTWSNYTKKLLSYFV